MWVEDAPEGQDAAGAGRPRRGGRQAGERRAGEGRWATAGARLPGEVGEEVRRSAEPRAARGLEARLSQAARAYGADRYEDAQRLLAPVVRALPDALAVRELYGLCLYRQGRWAAAIRQLDAFHRLSGSYDQHPVLADCHRALGHGTRVRQLWDELRRASPGGDLVAEGRIVMAETLAEEGDLSGAIVLLERSLRTSRAPRDRHFRQWYALADLYERAGELARARELFGRVLRHDPELSDTAERLAALG